MIIIVCTDDPTLQQIAQQSITANPDVFGNFYQVYGAGIPNLGLNENLFIISHGAYAGDGGNPVIGDSDAARAFYVNGVELWENIQTIFPLDYSGNVYIDACESADHNAYTFSFSEVFSTQIQAAFGTDNLVFGRNGNVGGLIPLPNDPNWVQAS